MFFIVPGTTTEAPADVDGVVVADAEVGADRLEPRDVLGPGDPLRVEEDGDIA